MIYALYCITAKPQGNFVEKEKRRKVEKEKKEKSVSHTQIAYMLTENFENFYLQCQASLLFNIQSKSKTFFETNDIKMKTKILHGIEYIKVKYDDNCKFGAPWKHACRGTTFVRHEDSIYRYFCINKFFNYHEIQREYKVSYEDLIKSLAKQGYTFLFMPKHDGSCLQCFTDIFGVQHRNTLGSLEENTIGDADVTYPKLTDILLLEQYPKLYDFLDANIGYSLICELVTPYNVIKTKYFAASNNDGVEVDMCTKFPRGFIKPLVLINPQGLPTWNHLNYLCDDDSFELTIPENTDTNNIHSNNISELKEVAPIIIPKNSWKFSTEDFNSVQYNAMIVLETNPEIYGHNPEGLVAYCYKGDVCFPIAKFKRLAYIQTGRDGVENLVHTVEEKCCKLQIMKLLNEYDDYDSTIDGSLQGMVDGHMSAFETYLIETGKLWESHEFLKSFQSQKEFAMHVQSLCSHLAVYSKALYLLRRKGFEFVSGFKLMVDLLTLDCRGKSLISEFQVIHGYKWFEKLPGCEEVKAGIEDMS